MGRKHMEVRAEQVRPLSPPAIGAWSNGKTAVSKTANSGSIPLASAIYDSFISTWLNNL